MARAAAGLDLRRSDACVPTILVAERVAIPLPRSGDPFGKTVHMQTLQLNGCMCEKIP